MSGRKPIAVWLGSVCAALISLSISPSAQAAVVTKIFEFNGAAQLWAWNTTGRTMLGEEVAPETLPMEMVDPARLSWYDADGSLLAVYRNYRPGEFQLLNDWKAATGTKLVRLSLAGAASGTGERTDWGEMLTVTEIGDPSHDPLFDSVGTNWFAQTAWDPDQGAVAPGWWCDDQADAIGKDLTGAFVDRAQYTFDDSAIRPDETVTLWFRGLVTEDLAGVQAGTAAYGILEGAMNVYANQDEDGDGYLSLFPGGVGDCDDDPTDDPPVCDVCSCGVVECAPCARCIHPGAIEFSGDAIDSNCNGESYHGVANSIAASYGRSSLIGSGVCNQIFLFLLPVGAFLLLRVLHRRK